MAYAETTSNTTNNDRSIDFCINQYNHGPLTPDCYYIQQMAYLGLHYDRYMLTQGNVIPANTLIVNGATQVTLSGLKSFDPNKDKLTYLWQQTAGDPVSFSSTTDPVITFMAPAVDAGQVKLLRVYLSVDDHHGGVDNTYINIIVVHVNLPPVVQVKTPITVDEGTQVTLSCSGTDPDGDKLSYSWGQFSGPRVKLSSYGDTSATFTAPIIYPDTTKVLLFLCTVDDGHGGKSSGTVTVYVKSTHVSPSVSCEDMSVNENSEVTLSATVMNPNNDVLTYKWKQISGVSVALSSSNDANPTFIAPAFSATGNELKFQVDVSNDFGDIQSCQLTVTVSTLPPQQEPPVADAGPDRTVNTGLQVVLDGSASTGKHLTYSWKQTGGEPVTLLFGGTVHPVFFSPYVGIGETKVLEFTLTVSNENGESSDSVSITVVNPNSPPTAIITPQ
jgi:chitinase